MKDINRVVKLTTGPCRRCTHHSSMHINHGQYIDCNQVLCGCKRYIPQEIPTEIKEWEPITKFRR